MSGERRQLAKKLRESKQFRDRFVSSHISRTVAAQIRAMRESQKWTQEELGKRLYGKTLSQPGIARLENPDYGRYNIETLKRIASALDVALVVRFVPFSELLNWSVQMTPDTFGVPNVEKDAGLVIPHASSDVVAAAGPRRVEILYPPEPSYNATEYAPPMVGLGNSGSIETPIYAN